MKFLLMFCAAFAMSVAWAQSPVEWSSDDASGVNAEQSSPPPPFNPALLDETTRRAYVLHLMKLARGDSSILTPVRGTPVAVWPAQSDRRASGRREAGATRSGAMPPPFNPAALDAQTQRSYVFHMMKHYPRALANAAPQGRAPITVSAASYADTTGMSEDEARMRGLVDASGSVVVGWVDCDIRAHDPRKSLYSREIEAKASGTCEFPPLDKAVRQVQRRCHGL